MKKEACAFYCEFCETEDLVIGKLKEHKRELLEARNVLINVKIETKNEEYIGTFKKHVETLHSIAS
jgi:hypothetical protein